MDLKLTREISLWKQIPALYRGYRLSAQIHPGLIWSMVVYSCMFMHGSISPSSSRYRIDSTASLPAQTNLIKFNDLQNMTDYPLAVVCKL